MSILVSGLVKKYGSQYAVAGIDFEVGSGEILGFLGPNGAGKSTSMKIITCFIPQDEGTVEVCGFDTRIQPMEVRRRVGYLPEHNPLYLDMYVHEFLTFAGNIHGMRGAGLKARIQEVIDMTGLGREQHKKIGMLSKGYRQRVGLGQALLHDPEVLILDEPTTGLDPNQIVEIRSLIKEIGKNKTVMFSSHILSEVEAIADRIVIINQGSIVADESTADIQIAAQDEHRVHVEFDVAGFDVGVIEAMEGVSRVERISDVAFYIYMSSEVDVRRDLFKACVAQDNVILSMTKEAFTLEDAFRKLTG